MSLKMSGSLRMGGGSEEREEEQEVAANWCMEEEMSGASLDALSRAATSRPFGTRRCGFVQAGQGRTCSSNSFFQYEGIYNFPFRKLG